FPRSDCDSGVYLCTESSICSLRVGDCLCVARCLASYPSGSALGAGFCLAPTVGNRRGGQRAHRYSRRAAAVGVRGRANKRPACDCSSGVWASCRGEIAPDCIAPTVLETCSCTRRSAGSGDRRAAICTISQPRPHFLRLARHLCAGFPVQRSRVCYAGASGRSTGCSRAGCARRVSYSNLDEKKIRGMVFGLIRLADDSVPSLCSGCLPMVPAVGATIRAVRLNAADHCMDCEHYPYLLRLASAHTWTPVVGS